MKITITIEGEQYRVPEAFRASLLFALHCRDRDGAIGDYLIFRASDVYANEMHPDEWVVPAADGCEFSIVSRGSPHGNRGWRVALIQRALDVELGLATDDDLSGKEQP